MKILNSDSWEEVKNLFHEALERPPEERERFLIAACGSDPAIREEVCQLLASFGEDEQFMETVAIGEVAEIIVGDHQKIKAGTTIGRYRTKFLLGKGGMGEVYLAEDKELERLAALKILSPLYAADNQRVSRFFQEARAASGLNHPNILTIYEIGRFAETYFIATEYVKGETLRDRQNRLSLNLGEIFKISAQVLSALQAAHDAKIIHRDIKPENIMLRDDALVKILDFGLAKLIAEKHEGIGAPKAGHNLVETASSVILGTVAYMSPEQARGKHMDIRTDLWSFGVCLYELLAGFQPFNGETMSDQIAEILTAGPLPLPPGIPAGLNRIVLKALQKDPQERYQNAREMLEDLKVLDQSLPEDRRAENPTTYQRARQTAGNRIRSGFSQLTAPLLTNLRLPAFSRFSAAAACFLLIILGLLAANYAYRKNSPHEPNPEAVRWFRLGNEAARNGNHHKAGKLLEQAVQADGEFLLAQAKLAEIWMELDYEDKAAQTMLRVTGLIPQLSGLTADEEIYLQAVLATVRRDYRGALVNYEKIAERAPEAEKTFALFDLGKALERVEDSGRALEIFEEVTRRDPQFAAAHLRLANLYWFRDERERALIAFETASTIFTAQSDYDSLGELFYQKGSLFNFNDDFPEARKNLEKSLELGKATANHQLQIKAMLDLGRIEFGLGDTTRARQLIDEGLQLARLEQLENLTTTGLIDLGTVFYLRGEYEEADKYLGQALQIARVNGGKRAEARALLSLGNLALLKVKPSEAVEFIKPALNFYSENNFRQEKSKALLALGYAYDQTGQYREALDLLTEVRQQAGEDDDPALIAHTEAALGLTLIHAERFSEALVRFENSFRLNQTLGREQIAAYDLLNQAQALIQLGRFSESRELISTTIRLAGRSGDKQLLAWTTLLKAQSALFSNDYPEAMSHSRAALKDSNGQIDEILITANLVAALSESRRGFFPKADEYLQKAFEVLEKTENPRLAANLRLSKAEILLKKGAASEALEEALKARETFVRQEARHSEWRALAIASEASFLLKNAPQAGEYARQANLQIITLERLWGKENYRSYAARRDVGFYLSQINQDQESKILNQQEK